MDEGTALLVQVGAHDLVQKGCRSIKKRPETNGAGLKKNIVVVGKLGRNRTTSRWSEVPVVG